MGIDILETGGGIDARSLTSSRLNVSPNESLTGPDLDRPEGSFRIRAEGGRQGSSVEITKITFGCRFNGDAILPAYKGSTLRGAFGSALKDVSCVLKQKECVECPLEPECVYSLFFEPKRVSDQAVRVATRPAPFALRSPRVSQELYSAGEALDFSLILFGQAAQHIPQVIWSVRRMGELGLGKSQDGERPGFGIVRVEQDGTPIFDKQTNELEQRPLRRLGLNLEELQPDRRFLRVEFLTPFRIKFRNRFAVEMPFDVLVRAALRRISTLCSFYGSGEPDLDYKELISQAGKVRIGLSQLRWIDWRRFSNRQRTSMQLGGLTGSISYEGELGRFEPLIRFVSETNLGKQTTFGLGEFRYFFT